MHMAAAGTFISGGGSFTLSSGATLGITSAAGITASGATGNIQVTGTRTYDTGANYIYNGSAAQVTGDGLPATVNNLTFNNTGGIVTFTSACTVTRDFSLTSGSVANLSTFTHPTGSLTLGGAGQPTGTYGHTGSGATYINDTYFDAATGIVNNASPAGTWLGITSTDWFTTSNWSGGTPGSGTDVIISSSATYQPVISGSVTALSNSAVINYGASLTIAPNGSATIPSLTNNGTLSINSASSGIGSLMTDTYSGTGTSNIQLYLTGGGGDNAWKWHYISSPVQNTPITVFNGNTQNLAQYDESLVTGSVHQGWVAATDGYWYSDETEPYTYYPAKVFSTLELGKGYAYYFGSEQTYTISGPINTGAVNVPLAYNTGNSGVSDIIGFNLIGNPFTSTLNWNVVDDYIGPNISTAIYATKDYTLYPAWNNGTATDGGTPYIVPMQAFFVEALATGQTLNLPVSAKSHLFDGPIRDRFKGSEEEVIPLVRLLLKGDGNSRDAVVRFDEKAQLTFDTNFDAYSLGKGLGPMSLWTKLEGIDYAINAIPYPETSIDIPVAMHAETAGTFTLSSNELNGLELYSVTLRDKTTNTIVDLKKGSELSFSISAGQYEDRFVLTISSISTGTEEIELPENAFNIYSFNEMLNIVPLSDEWNGKQGSVRIIDLTGKSILENRNLEFWKNSLIQLPVSGMKGIYIVEIRSGLMRYVGKVMIK